MVIGLVRKDMTDIYFFPIEVWYRNLRYIAISSAWQSPREGAKGRMIIRPYSRTLRMEQCVVSLLHDTSPAFQRSRASCPRQGRDALAPGRNGNTRKGKRKVRVAY